MKRAVSGCLALIWLTACSGNSPGSNGGKEIGAGRGRIAVQSPTPSTVKPKLPPPPGKPASATPRPTAPARVESEQSVNVGGHGGSGEALRLTLAVELLDETGSGSMVAPDRIFHSGERIRLHLRGSSAGFVTVLQIDAAGAASPLYPGPADTEDGALPADLDRGVPEAPAWLRFDQHPGTERLLVVFAKTHVASSELAVIPGRTEVLGGAATEGGLHGAKSLLLERPEAPGSPPVITAVSAHGGAIVLAVALRHE